MSRPKGSIIGAKPTWTTTATSGIWTLRQAEEMKAANQWPRGPEAPTSLAGTAGDEEVALTWTAPATTHGTITDYIVEYTPAAGSPTVVATGSTAASYTLTGLTNDTEYTFRVAGVNHTRGDFSSSVAVTPSGVPTDPDFASVSLLLHMDGSNGSTTFTDSSDSPKTVTSNGGVAISTAQSKFGGSSVLFDGTNDNLIIGSSSDLTFGTDSFVVEFWFYTTSNSSNLTNYGTFFSGLAGALNLRYNSVANSLSVGVEGVSYDLSPGSSSLPTENVWNHIAVVRDATNLRLYLDGTRVGTASAAQNYTNAITRIGRYESSALYHLNGYIDDFRVTKGTVRGYSGETIAVPTEPFPDA